MLRLARISNMLIINVKRRKFSKVTEKSCMIMHYKMFIYLLRKALVFLLTVPVACLEI